MTTYKLDAKESAHLQAELEAIEEELYELDFPKLKATSVLPVVSVGSGFQTVGYKQIERTGKAKFIGNGDNTLPSVNSSKKKFTEDIKHLATSYSVTIIDLRESMRTGENLPREDAETAKEVIAQQTDDIGFFGDQEENINGLISDISILTVYTPLADGTGGSTAEKKKFVNKTPIQIVRDLGSIIGEVRKATNDTNEASIVLIPLSLDIFISVTYVEQLRMTIKQAVLYNNPNVKIESLSKFENVTTATLTAKNPIVAYPLEKRVLKFHIPSPFEQFMPETTNGLEWTTACLEDVAGVVFNKPKAVVVCHEGW